MRLFILGLSLALVAPSLVEAAPRYRLIPLGDFPGGASMSWGYGLNNKGGAIGAGITEESMPGICGMLVSEAGERQALVGIPGSEPYDSRFFAISDTGDVVGTSLISIGHQATVWEDGVPRGLGYAGGCGDGLFSIANDISRMGRVVGTTSTSTCNSSAFYWDGAGMVLLPPGSEDYSGFTGEAISPGGRLIAGQLYQTNGSRQPFWWHIGADSLTVLPSPGEDDYAMDINDHGQVISHANYYNPSRVEGLLWSPEGDFQVIPPLADGHDIIRPFALNNHGEVVGTSWGGAGAGSFLWREDLGTVAIPSLVDGAEGWDLYIVEDINDYGYMIGTGFNPQGASEGFILEPIDDGSFGACCIDGDVCAQSGGTRCEAIGGVFYGVGSTCDDGDCEAPPVRGACCIDYDCQLMDPQTCGEEGGFYHGDGVTCPEDPCTPSSCSNTGGEGATGLLVLSLFVIPGLFSRRYRSF